MTQPSRFVKKIYENALELRKQNKPVLAVFDLDSTLFDVSPRLEKILMDFAQVPENQLKFPEQIPFFKNIKSLRSDWGIKNALIRAGLDGHHPEFQHAVRDFWSACFFTNEYLDYDVPYEGAVDFVNQLHEMGCEIVYLTGRDVARMGKGSPAILKKWNFPLNESSAQLVLKPHLSMDDAEFKVDWFLDIPREKYSKIFFFENEPVNIHLLQKKCDYVDIYFFESTHSGKAEAPEDLPRLLHFLMDEE